MSGKAKYRYDLWTRYYFEPDLGEAALSYFAYIADTSDEMCKDVTVLEKCGACAADYFKCSKPKNDLSDVPAELEISTVCMSFRDSDQLGHTPWCQGAMSSLAIPNCDCMPFYMGKRTVINFHCLSLCFHCLPVPQPVAVLNRCPSELAHRPLGMDWPHSAQHHRRHQDLAVTQAWFYRVGRPGRRQHVGGPRDQAARQP